MMEFIPNVATKKYRVYATTKDVSQEEIEIFIGRPVRKDEMYVRGHMFMIDATKEQASQILLFPGTKLVEV